MRSGTTRRSPTEREGARETTGYEPFQEEERDDRLRALPRGKRERETSVYEPEREDERDNRTRALRERNNRIRALRERGRERQQIMCPSRRRIETTGCEPFEREGEGENRLRAFPIGRETTGHDPFEGGGERDDRLRARREREGETEQVTSPSIKRERTSDNH